MEPIFQGKPDKEIAAELDLSIHTVRSYLKRIFDRAGVDGAQPLLARQPFHRELPFIQEALQPQLGKEKTMNRKTIPLLVAVSLK